MNCNESVSHFVIMNKHLLIVFEMLFMIPKILCRSVKKIIWCWNVWSECKILTSQLQILILIKFYFLQIWLTYWPLTHQGWMTHICVSNLTIMGSDNGLAMTSWQAIIRTNVGMLVGPLGTNFCEISIKTPAFSFKKMHLKTSSAKWRPFCLGLNVLMVPYVSTLVQVMACCLMTACHDLNQGWLIVSPAALHWKYFNSYKNIIWNYTLELKPHLLWPMCQCR